MQKQTMKLPEHLFVSSTDGHLYDTRRADWHKAEPLRKGYQAAYRTITTVANLKATMRVKYAWPGGYEIVYLTSDGAILCDKCVRKHFRSVVDSIRSDLKDGWRVIASATEQGARDCSEEFAYCDQCGREFGELA